MSKEGKITISISFVALFIMDCSPAVRAVLCRPAPFRLVTVLRNSVTRRLGVGASRLGLAASGLHVTASGLDSASGDWVRAVAASSTGRV